MISTAGQNSETTCGLAKGFQALSDQTRLKIAFLIADEDISVQDIAGRLGTTVQNVSSHLIVVKRCGMATCRREGKQVYYRLSTKAQAAIASMDEVLN